MRGRWRLAKRVSKVFFFFLFLHMGKNRVKHDVVDVLSPVGTRQSLTTIVFAVVVYHQRDLPLEDVTVSNEPHRDTREVLGRVDLLELSL